MVANTLPFCIHQMTIGPSSLTVTQFQYTNWPEYGPPPPITSLLELMDNVTKIQMSSQAKAVTVMCK